MGNKGRKRILKQLLFMIHLFVISVCLGGCSDENQSEEAQKECVITVWTKDRHDVQFQQQKIQEFNETNNENIRVEYRVFGDNYAQAVNNALLNQNAPDIMVYTSQILYDHINDGTYLDLIPLMTEEFKEIFGSLMFEEVNVFNGECYFIPTAASACRLFYNKTIFERAGIDTPPSTVEEMIEDSRIITQKLSGEGIYGFAANMKNAQSALNRSFMKEVNIDLGLKVGYDFAEGCYDFTGCDELVEAWRTLLSAECAYPDCRNLDIDPLRQLFADGKIGMYISYVHSERGAYPGQFPMEDEWGCTQLPTINGEIRGAQNYSLNNGYLLNAGSDHPQEAWKVYCEVFADVENLKEYYMSGFGISIVPEVLQAAAQEGYELEEPAYVIGENDGIWPLTPHERNSEALEISGLDMYDTFRELIFGSGDIRSELQDLTRRYNAAYEQGIALGIGEEIRIERFDPMHPGAGEHK